MNDLYNGRIEKKKINQTQIELGNLKSHLAKFPPKDIVWDFEDLNALPPWGDNISSEITDLSNYFLTSEGENLLDVLEKAMNTSIEIDEDLEVMSL